MSYELYWRKVGGEKMRSMPDDNDNDSNDGGGSGDYDDGDDEDDIDEMTIAEVGRWRENAEYALMIQTHSHPFLLLHRLQEPMLTTIVMILMM